MQGDSSQFEALGNRLGFHIVEDSADKLRLLWQGPRFPAILCLCIALLLLFVSVPILLAIHERGFSGPAGSLWYFPLMNIVLFGIALFLITQKRTIEFDHRENRVILTRQSLYRRITLAADYGEIVKIELALDLVNSGFAVAGSSAAEKFPVPALRLILSHSERVLLDRGSARRLKEIAERIARATEKPFATAHEVENQQPVRIARDQDALRNKT